MPRGGSKPGERRGGRARGARNKRTQEIAAQILSQGTSMIEIMAGTARALWEKAHDPKTGKIIDLSLAERAAEAAAKAAPYWHPRIQSVTLHGANDDGSFTFNVNLEGADAKA